MIQDYTNEKEVRVYKKISWAFGIFIFLPTIAMGISEIVNGRTLSGIGVMAIGLLWLLFMVSIISTLDNKIVIEDNTDILFKSGAFFINRRKRIPISDIAKIVYTVFPASKGTIGFEFYDRNNKRLFKISENLLQKEKFLERLRRINTHFEYIDDINMK